MKTIVLLNLLYSLNSVLCRDFYMGMFKRNDYLVAQDNVYRERRPFSSVIAEYGRLFKCPITYFRVVDRLGVGSGPTVKIVRGGLKKKYIAARIKSGYGLPVSVNVYVGCENKMPRTPGRPWITTTDADIDANDVTGDDKDSSDATTAGDDAESTTDNADTAADDDKTPPDGDADATTKAEGDAGDETTTEVTDAGAK